MNLELKVHRKTRHLLRILAVLLGALVAVSCATTPKPAPAATAPPPAPAKQATAPTAELQKAKSMKQEIDHYQLGALVPTAYKQGSDALAAGEQAIGTDNATAKEHLNTAIADFTKVLDNGLPLALKQEQQAVAKAKSAADAVDAAVAAPDLYGQGEAAEKQAQAKQQAGSLTEAYTLLEQAATAYDQAATAAKQERAAAQTALEQANQAVAHAKSQVEEIQKNFESSTSHDAASSSSGAAGSSPATTTQGGSGG